MVNHRLVFHEAISEIITMTHLHSSVVNKMIVSNFISYLLTGDNKTANLLWHSTLRARLYCCAMEEFLLETIDKHLEEINARN